MMRHYPDLSNSSDWMKQIFKQSEALLRSRLWCIIRMEFLCRRYFAGKPVVASPNVGCFLGLWEKLNFEDNFHCLIMISLKLFWKDKMWDCLLTTLLEEIVMALLCSKKRAKKKQTKYFMVYFLMSSVAEGSWTPSVVKVANLKNMNTLSTKSSPWKRTNLQTTESKTKPKRKTKTKKKTATTTTRKGVEGIVVVVTNSKWSGLAMSLLTKICIEKSCQELDYVTLVDVLIRIYLQFFFCAWIHSQSRPTASIVFVTFAVCIIFPYLALC